MKSWYLSNSYDNYAYSSAAYVYHDGLRVYIPSNMNLSRFLAMPFVSLYAVQCRTLHPRPLMIARDRWSRDLP